MVHVVKDKDFVEQPKRLPKPLRRPQRDQERRKVDEPPVCVPRDQVERQTDDALRQLVPQMDVVSFHRTSSSFRRGVVSISRAVPTMLMHCDRQNEPPKDVAALQQPRKLCDLLGTFVSDCVCRSNNLDVFGGSDVLDRAVHTALS